MSQAPLAAARCGAHGRFDFARAIEGRMVSAALARLSLTNAIYAATGKRIRALPIMNTDLAGSA
jgi:CO/xanthine dehydrogenase Mo-binding subunit